MIRTHSNTRMQNLSGPLRAQSPRSNGPATTFDTAAFDKQRLAADEQTRRDMSVKASAEEVIESQAPGENPGAWKWSIRKRIWDMMEEKNIARPPRPVHHRIPNFVGADQAANLLAQQAFFKSAQVIKVNPDTPQKQVRINVLNSGKKLLTPQPRLRTGFFSWLTRDKVPPGNDKVAEAATSAGAAKYGTPIGLDEKMKVDLIVVGSTCVTTEGARLGKGEGFAELEYGVLQWMGAIDEHTLIVTTIHDDQLVDASEIPREKLLEHDVPVDVIVTNTRVIFTNTKIPKPPGILWHKLSPQKLGQIKILRELKERIEKETGQPLPSGPDEILPPLAERNAPKREARKSRKDLADQEIKESNVIFLSNLDYHVNSAQIQDWIEETVGRDSVKKVTLINRGIKGRLTFTGMCVVDLEDVDSAKLALERLNGTDFMGRRVICRFDKFVGA